jgi:polyhydroxybutyrate depolymerase
VLVAAGCRGDGRPAPSGAAAARDVPPRPSAGCRPGTLSALVGERRTIVVDGLERSYLIDAAAARADDPRPVVLAFHGFRHSAAGLRSGLGLVELAAVGELVALHVEGRDGVRLLEREGRGWDTAPGDVRDAAFVRAILDAVEAERCIDRRRVFATGFSNGGFVSNLLGCQLSDRLAAVAPVAGARALDTCAPAAPVPILFFHGASDRVVPPRLTVAARAWWRTANRCGAGDEPRDGCVASRDCAADVVVCEGPQAHAWPEDATRRIWAFFRAHPRRD